jgi:hypothetical protein
MEEISMRHVWGGLAAIALTAVIAAATVLATRNEADAASPLSPLQVVTVTQTFTDTSPHTVTASCPAGKIAISGGASTALVHPGADAPPALFGTAPRGSPPTGWSATAGILLLSTPPNFTITAYAVCR